MAMLEELIETSPEFTAQAALVAGGTVETRRQSLDTQRTRLRLQFPFILKPDVGQRGAGVKLVRDETQLEKYLCQTSAPLVMQRYAAGPFEAGIFYYRFPGEPRGKIFAITEKIFPTLTGDGSSTIGELIKDDPRARLIQDTYARRFAVRLDEILSAGETLKLVEAGNHAQGCIFRDGMRLNTPELEARIDEISRKLDGFYIGRYDIRFASEEDLLIGRNFQIIELNGAASEATSIYDAEFIAVGISHFVPAVGAGFRHRRGEPGARLQANPVLARLENLAAIFPHGGNVSGGGLNIECVRSLLSHGKMDLYWA